jgi:hypothetical protein
VKGKLSDDLAPMDRGNSEEQSEVKIDELIRSRDDMKWIILFVIGWCMCCINIEGDGMECARQRYNLGHFISPVIGV